MPVLEPKLNTVYACLTPIRGAQRWARGWAFRSRVMDRKVVSVKGGSVSVYLMDVGRTVSTTSRALHELDAAYGQVAPLARHCVLAAVEVPPTGEWAAESRKCFEELAGDEQCRASVVLRDAQNRLSVFLYREGDEDVSVNEMMLNEGWGRLEASAYSRYKGSEDILNSMKNYQQDAKEDRVGIFQYGDIGFENDK